MPEFRVRFLAASCGLALVGGCAYFDRDSRPQQPALVPVSNVTHSSAINDPDYQIGRSYQARRQYDAAIAAYRKSLEAKPRNAEAHNALGVIYASQGKHDLALSELKAALALAPAAAHIHNNLGYAYLLAGRNEDALAALNMAVGLDPANERSRENIRIVRQRLGLDAVAPSSAQVGTVPATQANPTPPGPADTQPGMRLLAVAPNVYELRQGSAPQVPASLPLATPQEGVKLEIANGNGITGLAKRTASSLQRKGYTVARLTNQQPYTQATTEIQYRKGQEDQARRLNALFSAPAKVVESRQLRKDIGVRLVLGRDSVERSLFTEAETGQLVASR